MQRFGRPPEASSADPSCPPFARGRRTFAKLINIPYRVDNRDDRKVRKIKLARRI